MTRQAAAGRAMVFPLAGAAVVFGAAGRIDLPMVWAVFGVLAAFIAIAAALSDPGLIRERQAPGPGERDRFTRAIAIVLIVAHWILAGLDLGRFAWWPPIPRPLQIAGLIGYAACMGLMLWTMRVNRFYSSAVRVQRDRGHEVITRGPYRIVRHPGYAVSILAFLAGGAALGSWAGLIPIAPTALLFIRRTLIEDRMLRQELDGYERYAQRVRHRLIPGVF